MWKIVKVYHSIYCRCQRFSCCILNCLLAERFVIRKFRTVWLFGKEMFNLTHSCLGMQLPWRISTVVLFCFSGFPSYYLCWTPISMPKSVYSICFLCHLSTEWYVMAVFHSSRFSINVLLWVSFFFFSSCQSNFIEMGVVR